MNSTTISNSTAWNTVQEENQYSLVKILGIWVAVVAPMVILAWVVKPALAPDFDSDPIGVGKVKLGLLSVGLIWQFVLSMIIVYREKGDLRWATIRQRLWLNKPRDPKTGEPRSKLWLWLIPFILLIFVIWSISPLLWDRWFVSLFPLFAAPPDGNIGEVLQLPGVQDQLVGDWLFMGLFLLLAVFNILGEEFIFRGVLLPKMGGVFGKWDWVANGVLFGGYHWHQPWQIPGSIVVGIFALALPAKRFRSTWMSIIIHSMQYVILPLAVMGVLGLV
jgi:membrane protease YdiL (CAAX protease family)